MRNADALFPPACRGQRDIALRTQLSLVRNHADRPFPPQLSRRDGARYADELCRRVREVFGAEDVTEDPAVTDLAEVSFGLSPVSKRGPFYRLLLTRLPDGGCFWTEVGAVNHLTFSLLSDGGPIADRAQVLWDLAALYERRYPFAYAEPWGYLTGQLSFTGTGFRIRTWVHVPGLAHFDHLAQLCNAAERYGSLMEIEGPEDETPPGNLAILFNRSTMDAPVRAIAESHVSFLGMLCDAEDQARRRLRLDFPFVLYDRLKRMRGLLRDAEMLEPDEALDLLSAYRLGVATGALKCPPAKAGFPPDWFDVAEDGPMLHRLDQLLQPDEQRALLASLPPGAERHGMQYNCFRAALLRRMLPVRLDAAFVREARTWRG